MPADQSSSTPSKPPEGSSPAGRAPAGESSPTRLFATLSGAVLVVGGTVGFFHASTFGTPGEVEDALGFAVNGWINTLHIVVGAIGLFAAGFAARAYSLGAAILFGALAIWGFALGSDEALLDRFPADEAENLLHALLAGLGLAAWLAERPRRERKPREQRPPRSPKDEPRDRESERRAREAKRREREERRRKKRDKREQREAKKPSKAAGEDRSRQSEAGDDPASRDDEPRTEPERPSQRRRRRRRPPA